LLIAPFGAQAAPKPRGTVSAPVTGTFTDALGGTGTFTGTFTPTRFVTQNGQLAAVGTLTGTLVDSLGAVVGTVSQQVTTLVTQAQGSCQILHLELGPLDLDLLGLQVHLDQVVLDITAQQGPGNLLGNLLCAIANLLNNNGPLSALTQLLNQLLALLR
jgi:phage-related protein